MKKRLSINLIGIEVSQLIIQKNFICDLQEMFRDIYLSISCNYSN